MLELVDSIGDLSVMCKLPRDAVVRVGGGEREAGIFRLCDLGRSTVCVTLVDMCESCADVR